MDRKNNQRKHRLIECVLCPKCEWVHKRDILVEIDMFYYCECELCGNIFTKIYREDTEETNV